MEEPKMVNNTNWLNNNKQIPDNNAKNLLTHWQVYQIVSSRKMEVQVWFFPRDLCFVCLIMIIY